MAAYHPLWQYSTGLTEPELNRKEDSMILRCTCENKGQDKLHGIGNRVFNRCKPKEDVPHYKCSVCGAIQQVSSKRGG